MRTQRPKGKTAVIFVSLFVLGIYLVLRPTHESQQTPAPTATAAASIPPLAPTAAPIVAPIAPSGAAPIVQTEDGLRRVSPHGVVAPTPADTTEVDEVDYDNPNTGTQSTYELEVDRDAEGNVERINFDNGGWREVDGETVDNGDGTETYTADDGAEYTIHRAEDTTPKDTDTDTDTDNNDDSQ